MSCSQTEVLPKLVLASGLLSPSLHFPDLHGTSIFFSSPVLWRQGIFYSFLSSELFHKWHSPCSFIGLRLYSTFFKLHSFLMWAFFTLCTYCKVLPHINRTGYKMALNTRSFVLLETNLLPNRTERLQYSVMLMPVCIGFLHAVFPSFCNTKMFVCANLKWLVKNF